MHRAWWNMKLTAGDNIVEDLKPLRLTLEDGRRALGVHVLEKGHRLNQKYGKFIDYETLLKILQDEEFVRYSTRIEFCSA